MSTPPPSLCFFFFILFYLYCRTTDFPHGEEQEISSHLSRSEVFFRWGSELSFVFLSSNRKTMKAWKSSFLTIHTDCSTCLRSSSPSCHVGNVAYLPLSLIRVFFQNTSSFSSSSFASHFSFGPQSISPPSQFLFLYNKSRATATYDILSSSPSNSKKRCLSVYV